MKSSAKILIALGLLLFLPALAWTATFLYWDMRIRGAIREFTDHNRWGPLHPHEVDQVLAGGVLERAGCRSYPYLVSGLQTPEQQVALTTALSYLLSGRIPRGQNAGEELNVAIGTMRQARIRPGDSPEERRRKALLVRDWWMTRGREQHQWWRVWSSNCSAN